MAPIWKMYLFMSVLLSAVSVLFAWPLPHRVSTALKTVVSSEVRFAKDLYELISPEPGNLCFSPLSIHTVLGMAFLGARGTTATQMRTALHLRSDDQMIRDGYRDLTMLTKSGDAYDLETANKIYVRDGVQLESEYTTLTQKYFASSVEHVDFEHDAEGARTAINAWVGGQTRGKIPDLVKEGAVNADTDLVLVSATYFNGSWAKPFKPEETRPGPFYVKPDDSRDVPMMLQFNQFNYAENQKLDCKLLELPYKDSNLSMLVALPNKMDGIAQLDAELMETSLVGWTALMNSMRQVEVKLTLPRFTLHQTHDLGQLLRKRGMVDMFNAADFSGMTKTRLKVSAVLHEAFIEVNELGTKAAAATFVGAVGISLPKTYEFTADHPFIVLIRDKGSEAVLFGGRLSSV